MRDAEAIRKRNQRLAKLSRSTLQRIANDLLAKANGRKKRKRKKGG